MSEIDPAQKPEKPVPKFRVNAQVFQILGLLAVALALPITILILGINGIRKERHPPAPSEAQASRSTPEVPGLRQSLESIANSNLPTGPIESPMRIFSLRYKDPAQRDQKCNEVRNLLARLEMPFLETSKSAAESWITTGETVNAQSFEDRLVQIGFAPKTSGEGNIPNDSSALDRKTTIYQITIEALDL